MSFNQFIHPRNIFRNKPNYEQLGKLYHEFNSILSYDSRRRPSIDYSDPKSLKLLTITLLKFYFDLNVQIPNDRLIPTLPMRLNYLLWIEDLLKHCKLVYNSQTIIGLDIGTGCCAIFPLLGVKLNPNLNFIATEIDEVNFEYAKLNICANDCSNRIKCMYLFIYIYLCQNNFLYLF